MEQKVRDEVLCICGHGLGDHQSASGCTHARMQYSPYELREVEVRCTCTVFRERREID